MQHEKLIVEQSASLIGALVEVELRAEVAQVLPENPWFPRVERRHNEPEY